MFEIDKQKFGTFIAELRKEKGMTQRELAEKLFISDKAVSKWETAQSIPDITLLKPLSEILGVTTTELLESRKISPEVILNTVRTDELLHTMMEYPEKQMEILRMERKRDRLLFVFCMILGFLETLLYANMSGEPMWIVTGPISINFSNVLTIEILCLIFGSYFCFFVKERLPRYYAEDKISQYSHGIFRMNIPGIHLNNSNWHYIVKIVRRWCMTTAVIFPMICIGFWVLYVSHYGSFHTFSLLVLLFGGLLLPVYIVARKYE